MGMGHRGAKVKDAAKAGSLFHRLTFGVIVCVSLVVSLLPRGAMVKVGHSLGALAYVLWKGRRGVALGNLDLAFGETKTADEKKRIARESFETIGASLMELAWGMRRMNDEVFSEVTEDEGVDVLRPVLARGKGTLMLPAHYGNWELLTNVSGHVGFIAYFVTKRLKNPYLDRMVNDYRCRRNNHVIHMNGASKEMEDALTAGHVVATLLDQKVPVRRGGILVDFFGHPAATTPLIAKLHLATGAPLIHVRCYPNRDGTCRIVFGPEVDFEPSGDYEQDVHDLTQQCVAYMESYIRETPQFWLWGHKRWKVDSGTVGGQSGK